MTSIAQAYVEILPSAKGMGRALQGEMGGMQSTLSDGTRRGFLGGFSNLAGPLAAVIGGLGIGQAISSSISAASDLSETRSAVQTVFGDAGAAVQDFASTAATELGQTEQQALEAARTFGIFGQAAGLSGGDLSTFSTDLVGLAGDFASFNNVEPDVAIQAIGAGLRGESEPLRQFGILLDDAALKARAMEMGIYDGNGALTQQQRVMAAQAEIFAQAGVQAGDFERTSGGLANQQRILQASWADLSATIGMVFLPIATSVVTFINDHIMPALSGFADMLADGGLVGVLESLAGARSSFFDAAMGALPGLVDGFVAMLPAIVGFITGTMIPQLVDEFLTLVVTVVGVLTQVIPQIAAMLPAIVESVVAIIPSIITGLLGALPMLLQGAMSLFMALVDAVALVVPLVIDALVGALPGIVGALLAMLPQLLETATDLFSRLVEALVTVVPALLTAIVGMLPAIVSALLTMLPALLEAAVGLFVSLVTAVITVVPQLLTAIVGMLPGILSALLAMLPGLLSAAVGLFMSLVQALITVVPQLLMAIVGMLPVILTTLIGMIPTLLTTAISLFMQIVMALVQVVPALVGAIIEMLPVIIATLIGLIPVLLGAAIELFTALLTGLIENLPLIIDFLIFDMIPAIVDAIINAAPQLLSAGVALMQAFIDGIGSMLGAIGDVVGGVMDFVAGFFPNSPAKRGPLSGSGWRAIGKSGSAIEDAFASGFSGRIDDVITSGVSIPRVPVSAEVASYAAGVGGAGATVNVYPSQSMDPYAVGRIAGDELDYLLRSAS